MDIKSFSEELRGYFNLQADRDHEEAIVSQISNYCCPVKFMKRFKTNISPDSRYVWYTYEPF